MPAKSILPPQWELPSTIVERLGEEAGRQRAMTADGHLLLVLHVPPGPEDLARKGRFFWRKPDGSWRSDALGAGPPAVARHLDEYTRLINDLESLGDAAKVALEIEQVGRPHRELADHAVGRQGIDPVGG